MKHMYHMIKNANPPNVEHKTFFEGGPGTGEGDVNPDSIKCKSVEDFSTKGEKKMKKLKGEVEEFQSREIKEKGNSL